jgi:predicted nucleotidyltransferase
MSGIDLREDTLVVERDPNQLDDLALSFSGVLRELDIAHVFIAGYVSILAGRARSTEDVDVLIEELDEDSVTELADELAARGFWGPAMPLTSMYEMLSGGDNIWVAPDDQVTPHLEVKFVRDEFDRASLIDLLLRVNAEESPSVGILRFARHSAVACGWNPRVRLN